MNKIDKKLIQELVKEELQSLGVTNIKLIDLPDGMVADSTATTQSGRVKKFDSTLEVLPVKDGVASIDAVNKGQLDTKIDKTGGATIGNFVQIDDVNMDSLSDSGFNSATFVGAIGSGGIGELVKTTSTGPLIGVEPVNGKLAADVVTSTESSVNANEAVVFGDTSGKVVATSGITIFQPNNPSTDFVVSSYTNQNTVGVRTTAFGKSPVNKALSTTFDCTALGNQALELGQNCARTTAVGSQILIDHATTLSNSVAIGTNLITAFNSGSQNIIIGVGDELHDMECNNTMAIGGTYFGRVKSGQVASEFQSKNIVSVADAGGGQITVTVDSAWDDNVVVGGSVIFEGITMTINGTLTSTSDAGSNKTLLTLDSGVDVNMANDNRMEISGTSDYDGIHTISNFNFSAQQAEIDVQFTNDQSGTWTMVYDGVWDIKAVSGSTITVETPFLVTTANGTAKVKEPGQAVLNLEKTPTTDVSLELPAGTQALLLNRLTSTAETALTKTNGMMWYNSTDDNFNVYQGGAVQTLVTDVASDAFIATRLDLGSGTFAAVTINTIDVWENIDLTPVNAAYTYSNLNSTAMTLDDADTGDVSFDSDQTVLKYITYDLIAQRVGGSTQNVEFGIAKNGTVITESIFRIQFDNNSARTVTKATFVIENALSTDSFQPVVRNRTSTANVEFTVVNFNVI